MSETAIEQTQEWVPKNNPWLIIMPVMIATFMYALDETVANVALPHIAGTFSVSSQESIWVLTSYLMASSIVIPMIDFLCKLMGRKNFFMLGVFVFTIASFLCGIANSIVMIVIARALQGFGGGCLMPMAQAVCMSLDNIDFENIVGTIAGDDTIFVLCRNLKATEEMLNKFRKLI